MNARLSPLSLAHPDLRFAATRSGLNVPFVARGEGEPVIFVHGSLCDYRYWSGQAAILSRSFMCISLSLSHYWPVAQDRAQSDFTWKAHVAELAEFIEALNLGPVHLVGHSRGGCIAFHMAQQYPYLVQTLTLADPGGPLQTGDTPPPALPPATAALRAEVAALIEAGEIDAGLTMFVDSVSMPGTWSKSPAGFRNMAIDNALTLPKQFRDELPAYTQALAAGVRCKTLLVQGERSPHTYRDNVAQLQQWLPQADKQQIAGASHGMNVSHPAAFNRVLQAFIDGAGR